jgi:uncharacterized membrane protein
MFETLKIFHLLGLILAFAGGIGNMFAGMKLSAIPPEGARAVGGFRISLGKLSTMGLILLWLTGVWMVATNGGWSVFDDLTFVLKFAAVLVVTGFSIAANITVARARKAATPPDAARMKMIGQGAMLFALVAMILAVITFA